MIQPGLERIGLLLKDVNFSWKAIHVAGTNGKGSICHYASALLRRRSIRTGSFTTPHLINRWDSIKINDKPIEEDKFKRIEDYYIQLNKIEGINASPFEILTATAFTAFEKAKCKLGVVEVGMGGLLDATNILNNQAVSVIARIAKDHEAFLGNTLFEIAKHKAGILRPGVPYIVNPENEFAVQAVIDDYAKEIGAGPRLSLETDGLKQHLFSTDNWRCYGPGCKGIWQSKLVYDWDELGKKRFEEIPGRLNETKVVPVFGTASDVGRTIVVDGAHNVNAAQALDEFVQRKCRMKWVNEQPPPTRDGWPITWVIAMTEGKDAKHFLERLLRPGDKVITTGYGPVDGMPWVKPVDPQRLLDRALKCPGVTGFAIPGQGALRALHAAKFLAKDDPIVLTGSLYFVGDFFRELHGNTDRRFWWKEHWTQKRAHMDKFEQEGKERVNLFLRNQDASHLDHAQSNTPLPSAERLQNLTSEIEDLSKQLTLITIEEKQVEQKHPVIQPPSIDDVKWTDVKGAKTWPSTDNPPPSDRPHATRYKELRERANALRLEHKSSPIRMFPSKFTKDDYILTPDTVQSDTVGPRISKHSDDREKANQRKGELRISMHFKDDEGADRRNFRRPDFVAEKKWRS